MKLSDMLFANAMMGEGGGGGERVVLIPQQSFTGVAENNYYSATLENAIGVSASVAFITYDGISYECNHGDYGYGAPWVDGNLDFSVFPFYVETNGFIAVADGNSHTIKVEADSVFPFGTLNITESGEYNVSPYATATVNVPFSIAEVTISVGNGIDTSDMKLPVVEGEELLVVAVQSMTYDIPLYYGSCRLTWYGANNIATTGNIDARADGGWFVTITGNGTITIS